MQQKKHKLPGYFNGIFIIIQIVAYTKYTNRPTQWKIE